MYPIHNYLGLVGSCASDAKNDRTLNGHFETSDFMTIQLCLSICREKEYDFAGLEYYDECYCGDRPDNGFDWIWQTECDIRCSGDDEQICGGNNAMSVWTVPSKNLYGLCVYDFPNHVLSAQSRSGLETLTVQWCEFFCAGIWMKTKREFGQFNKFNINELRLLSNTNRGARSETLQWPEKLESLILKVHLVYIITSYVRQESKKAFIQNNLVWSACAKRFYGVVDIRDPRKTVSGTRPFPMIFINYVPGSRPFPIFSEIMFPVRIEPRNDSFFWDNS